MITQIIKFFRNISEDMSTAPTTTTTGLVIVIGLRVRPYAMPFQLSDCASSHTTILKKFNWIIVYFVPQNFLNPLSMFSERTLEKMQVY